jgi:hypothetical protein
MNNFTEKFEKMRIAGHYGDTSRMFCIRKTSVKLNNLIDATIESDGGKL